MGFWVSGFGVGVSGFESRVPGLDFGFRVCQDFMAGVGLMVSLVGGTVFFFWHSQKCRALLESLVPGSGFQVPVFGFPASGSNFRVH